MMRAEPAPADYVITAGKEYLYTAIHPPGCQGHRYLVHRFLKQEPAKQELVLVECLTGPDAGKWFCCTPSNFSTRYEPAEKPPEPGHVIPFVNDRPAGRYEGSGK